MKLVKLIVIGILFHLSTLTKAQDVSELDPDYRLPITITPSLYTITLTLEDEFWSSKTFTGIVIIDIAIPDEVEEIILNSVGIKEYTGGVSLISTSDTETTIPLSVETNADLQRIVLRREVNEEDEDGEGGEDPEGVTAIAADNYRLVFDGYIGTLYEDMYGFYLSSYYNEDSPENEPEYIATTQFQTTYARRAFPCFDEPSFKARFAISVTAPEGYNVLSNARIQSMPGDVGNTYSFEETPTMSTYLVAFIVSKFKGYGAEYDSEAEGNGENDSTKKYDVFSREEALGTAKYSYEVGQEILEALDTFTGIPYDTIVNSHKMHQVAIPDFSAGAMENWGLVTYRETALLWDEDDSTASYKQRVATVIAHEFTHMWFGNLVTCSWWEYTWLNEGFARYFQYFITAEVEDTWELEKQFLIEQQQVIFATDALTSAFALNSEAATPAEISAKFGSISYNKGASIIRMMKNFIGEDDFNNGLKNYLDLKQGESAVPGELYNAFEVSVPIGESLIPLSDIMDAWTNNAGYPVVKVDRDEDGITFSQKRFLLDPSAIADSPGWYVPLTYTDSTAPDFIDTTIKEWLEPSGDSTLEVFNHTGWMLVNVLETGYYRVNYDEGLWQDLEDALLEDGFSSIPDLNRAQIVDDALNLARADELSYSTALNVTMFLQNDDSYYSWYAAFNAFSFLRRRIDRTSEPGKYLATHITTLMERLNETVTFDSVTTDDHVAILKTALVLQWACELEIETCTTQATELYEKLVNEEEAVNPNLRSTVYCSAIRQAETRAFWDFLWNKFQAATLATEQITILTALGCSQDEDVLLEYLGYSIEENSGIRKQDANYAFSGVLAGNPGNVDIALAFLIEKIADVAVYYEGMNALGSILTGIADRITTEEQFATFEAFIDANLAGHLSAVASTAQTAKESATANLNWVESNIDELDEWLEARYGSATSVTLNLMVLSVALVTAIKNFL